ncbi:MAG: trigger factor [Armatimonadota bacterium]|nr:trigger factor [Armatimonadota bacterium]MDR7562775.1 trigger factor [Armatimonadota bacterium]MDR7600912.1 trigger factor [Armatimonadota bacterium]
MLRVEVHREPGSRAVLEVEVPPERVNRALERAFARLGRSTTVPGFRRGRAPRFLLERYLGKQVVQETALEELVPEVLQEVVTQTGIRPITRPQVDVENLVEGQPLRLRATVEVVPEVRPMDYRSLRIPRPESRVTEEEVDRALEAMRAQLAQLVAKEGPAEVGDFVLVRVEEAPEGEPRFGPGKELLLEVGGQETPQVLAEALRGVREGQAVEVPWNGKGVLRVVVVGVRSRDLPPLDDAFARQVSDHQTLEALREEVRKKLVEEAARRVAEEYETEVLRRVVEGSEVDLPSSLVHAEIHALLEDLVDRLRARGLTLERYLALSAKTLEQLHEEYRPVAERRVRARLVLDRIADLEHLEPTEEELRQEVENLAQELGQEAAEVQRWLEEEGRGSFLRSQLRRRKTLAFLVAVASGAEVQSLSGEEPV